MTKDQFINHEIATWGEEYIFNLLDRGFVPVRVFNQEGAVKWTWKQPVFSQLSQLSSVSS
jgi:hypothetical protein